MHQTINESISVISHYNAQTKQTLPIKIKWRNQLYPIEQIGLCHHYVVGHRLTHIFSVISQGLFLRLKFDAQNLQWTLEEINDGEVG